MKGLLSGINDVIMVSWRPSAKAAENRPVEKLSEYCGRWGYHPQHHTVSEVLDFLNALFLQGLEYSSIKSHLSA